MKRDLIEFQRPLDGILRPNDLAWAAVSHARMGSRRL